MTPPTTPEPTAAPTTTPLETTTPLDPPPTTPNHATTSSTHPSSATTESTDTITEATTLSKNASWVDETIQVGLLTTPTLQSYEELVGPLSREEAEVTLPALRAGEVVTMEPLIEALPSSSSEVVTLSQAEMDIDALIDTSVPVSSASSPSGDGEAGPDSSDFPLDPDTDYQSDSADLFLLVSVVPRANSARCRCWRFNVPKA